MDQGVAHHLHGRLVPLVLNEFPVVALFTALAARHGARVNVKPAGFGAIFAATGGLPLAQRPKPRQDYRLEFLDRALARG